jgi:WW domain-binding protein 2
VAKPTSGGGVPADVPLIKIQFTFSDGGHNDFFQTFTLIKERLHHAREMGMDTRGRDVDIEPPPIYSIGGAAEHPRASGGQSAAAPSTQQTSRQPPPPDGPPPDYEEARGSLVNVDLEDQSRVAAERG